MTLIMFVLTMNVFIFNGSYYHQLWGTAMGTRVALSYACIFMGFMEIALLGAWTGTKLSMYRRYIDDGFFLWDGTKEELSEFIKHCNSFHPTIKFTFEFNFETKSVNFLDMVIWIDDNGMIQTDLFKKAGRKNQYLLPSSAHPQHTTKGIPFSLAYRIRRICSLAPSTENFSALDDWNTLQDERMRKFQTVPQQLSSRLEDLKKDLKARKYKDSYILPAFEKALKITRDKALEKVLKVDNKEKRINLPIPFNPRLPNYGAIIKQHWAYMIKNYPDLKKVLEAPPRICFRRPKNLRDLFVRAKLPHPTGGKIFRKKQGFKRCMNTRCQCCPFTINTKTHTSLHSKKTWEIQTPVDCNTKNCIYAVTCTKGGSPGSSCGLECQYIGLTKRKAKTRWGEHKTSARPLIQNTSKPVGKHFCEKSHEIHDMSFVIIEEVKSKNPFVLKAREAYWIKQYDAVNHGLNLEE